MQIRAKFKCSHFLDYNGEGNYTNRKFFFSAIYGKDGENAQFAKATPSGTLEIMVDKDTAAFDLWKPGREYYLTFEEVPKPGTV